MSPPVMPAEALAAIDLIGRTGATHFTIRYSEEPDEPLDEMVAAWVAEGAADPTIFLAARQPHKT